MVQLPAGRPADRPPEILVTTHLPRQGATHPVERLGYFWYEAPLPPDDIEGYVDVRSRVDVPLTAGRPGLGLPIDWEQVAAGTELEI